MANINRVPHSIGEVFYRLNVQVPVDSGLLSEAFRSILMLKDDQLRDLLLSAFLTSTMVRGPSLEEIVSLIRVVFEMDGFSPEAATRVVLPGAEMLIGCVGSGKKGLKTINISTPSCVIAASLGVYVAKSGSASTSSRTGSSDFMRAIGARLDISVEKMIEVLLSTHLGFFEIEGMLPRFDRVYGRRFYAPHILSFGLAGLMSPVRLDHLLYGLAHPNVELALKVLREFGVRNAMVVSCTHDGIHFLDEMGIYGKTRLIGMRDARIGRLVEFDPTSIANVPRYSPADIRQKTTLRKNVQVAIDALCGVADAAYTDIICMNAANLLILAGKAGGLQDGYDMARRAVKDGMPLDLLRKFVAQTGGNSANLNEFTA